MNMITKDMKIEDIIEINSNAPAILMSEGMHCLGCVMAHTENLAEAAEVHGIDIDELVNKLNEME
ncbi:MAG: DUF1858 domain-containing protein [Firmicutes bacterium]|nr:DUF1858 domain-containing protein [Bacillota bacterium]